MAQSIIVPISAIEHHEYCPRQCALIHVDGLWAENEHTVDGSRFHRRVDTAPARRERGRLVLRGIPLWSESLGLSGRADAVEVTADGVIRPVEYKSGHRHGLAADLQLCAQALCLEEMLACSVPTGDIWYGGTRRRHRIAFDDGLRARTAEVVGAIRQSMLTGILPDAVNDRRCASCQLEPFCLPQVTSTPERVLRYVAEEVDLCGT